MRARLLIIGLFLFHLGKTHSQVDCRQNPAACLEQIQSAGNPPTAAEGCADNDSVNQACRDRDRRLTADGIVNVTLAWGYTDLNGRNSDLVWGEYWNNLALEKLTGPCPSIFVLSLDRIASPEQAADFERDQRLTNCGRGRSYSHSCGFRRTDDPEILEKTIMRRSGPIVVRMRVMNAALGSSDSANRASNRTFIAERVCQRFQGTSHAACVNRNTSALLTNAILLPYCRPGDHIRFQICRSDYTRRAWQNAIRNGDEIVMYNGHARNGGGPSFDLPRVLANGNVDYTWYQSAREGHNQEAAAFRQALARGRPPVYYASHSCNSARWFLTNGHFPEVSPSTAYVLSNRTSFSDEGVASVLAILETAFSGLDCAPVTG
jgi:hypothetical protein